MVNLMGRSCILFLLTVMGLGCEQVDPSQEDAMGAGGSEGVDRPRRFDPCAGRSCGDICPACDINDPECIPIAVELFCTAGGSCVDSNENLGCEEEEENLCLNVECERRDDWCEGTLAYGGYPSSCNPDTGQCEPAPAPPPQDCAEEGLVCREGQCAEPTCNETNCASTPPRCEGSLRIPGPYRYCENDVCVEYPPEVLIDCADTDQICEDARCIGPPFDACADRECGEICPACDVDDPECAPISEELLCNADGECVSGEEELFCDEGPGTE